MNYENSARIFFLPKNTLRICISCVVSLFILHLNWNNNEMCDRLIYGGCVCVHMIQTFRFRYQRFVYSFTRQWIMYTKIDSRSCGNRWRCRSHSRHRNCFHVLFLDSLIDTAVTATRSSTTSSPKYYNRISITLVLNGGNVYRLCCFWKF